MERTKEQTAVHVSVVGIILNTALSIMKLVAGLMAGSSAMVSDAVHSMSDVASSAVVMVGIKMASRNPDEDHPYGHDRMESVAAVILSGILLAAGIGIGWSGIGKAFFGHDPIKTPGLLAAVAAIVSIGVKEGLFRYTKRASKKLSSSGLMAEAWHHRSDALSSVGSLAGILGARMGIPILDPLASAAIAVFIVKTSVDIFIKAMGQMTDKAADAKTSKSIMELAASIDGVLSVDQLKTRMFADKIFVDVEIGAKGSYSLNESHAIAQKVHDEIELAFPEVKHCMVHVNPR
jgi:cation diffusion facilitator family transporter